MKFRNPVHRLGERLEVADYSLVQAVSWWLASELVRRHPRRAHVVETHPGGGQYDCLSVVVAPTKAHPEYRAVHLNRAAGGHLTVEGPGADLERRFHWLDVLLAQDRRDYVVRQVEKALGLKSPSGTPATTQASVGPRLLATFLRRSLFEQRTWYVASGSADGASVRTELFDAVPGIDHLAEVAVVDARYGVRAGRYFFAASAYNSYGGDMPGPPVVGPTFAVDLVAGRAWTPQQSVDLLAAYEHLGRSMDALVNLVCPTTC